MYRSILSAVVIVATLGVIHAELCTPDQWEGYLHRHTSYDQLGPHYVDNMITIGYDAKNGTKVFNMKVTADGTVAHYYQLFRYDPLFNTLTIYLGNTSYCSVAVSTAAKFPKACLPGDAKSEGDAHLGILGKGGVKVTDYSYKIREGKEIPDVVTVTHLDGGRIFPIHASHNGGVPYSFQDMVFFNTTAGIKDPSVFDLPKYCDILLIEQGIENYTKWFILMARVESQGHDEQKHLVCPVCAKTFVYARLLRKHIYYHKRGKCYECHVCQSLFHCNFNLTVHMRSHTGEKPFECPECDTAFSSKHSRKVHMTIHTGEKPYVCSECDKAFRQLNVLHNHMVTHTGEKPYICPLCDQRFGRRSSMMSHLKNITHIPRTNTTFGMVS